MTISLYAENIHDGTLGNLGGSDHGLFLASHVLQETFHVERQRHVAIFPGRIGLAVVEGQNLRDTKDDFFVLHTSSKKKKTGIVPVGLSAILCGLFCFIRFKRKKDKLTKDAIL